LTLSRRSGIRRKIPIKPLDFLEKKTLNCPSIYEIDFVIIPHDGMAQAKSPDGILEMRAITEKSKPSMESSIG
jgi:hypothetical protein